MKKKVKDQYREVKYPKINHKLSISVNSSYIKLIFGERGLQKLSKSTRKEKYKEEQENQTKIWLKDIL